MTLAQTPAARAQLPAINELVVISPDLQDNRFLMQNAPPQAAVLRLCQEQNGLAAIWQRLAALPPIHRIHLVTPSRGEGLQLGSVLLRYDTVPNYASALCQWRSRLAPKAEILIYNDQAARTEAGKLLIDILHYLTGAAIAVCTTLPNTLAPTGKWELDCVTQILQPELTFSPAVVTQTRASKNISNYGEIN
ncbi:DUF4347 domain-containing protein [Nodosilinea sp. AN01ver1]|uniref:DUF4347 domain-containing protein n=1 Tax=Nodosilinea sp. AN01ver1 TaxID=3423362 RepID=UPI003D31FD31